MCERSRYVERAGLQSTSACLMLHTTMNPALRLGLRKMARIDPDVSCALQSVHSERVIATIRSCPTILSFVPDGDGAMVFAGMWSMDGHLDRPLHDFETDLRYRRLCDEWRDGEAWTYGREAGSTSRPYLLLSPSVGLRDYIDRLHIEWPTSPRTHVRRLSVYDPQTWIGDRKEVPDGP